MFGKSKTPRERMREYKRSIDRSIRDLDRERAKMEASEKKMISDIKKLAQKGQTNAAKAMARDLVRQRKAVEQFYKMRTQLQAISLRIQTAGSSAQMASAMKGVTKNMKAMNAKMNVPALAKIMMEFDRQNEMMGMKEEMMDDAMDDVLGSEDEEEETDELVAKVMDEIGIELSGAMADTPMQSTSAQAAESTEEEKDLEARLSALKRS